MRHQPFKFRVIPIQPYGMWDPDPIHRDVLVIVRATKRERKREEQKCHGGRKTSANLVRISATEPMILMGVTAMILNYYWQVRSSSSRVLFNVRTSRRPSTEIWVTVAFPGSKKGGLVTGSNPKPETFPLVNCATSGPWVAGMLPTK